MSYIGVAQNRNRSLKIARRVFSPLIELLLQSGGCRAPELSSFECPYLLTTPTVKTLTANTRINSWRGIKPDVERILSGRKLVPVNPQIHTNTSNLELAAIKSAA